MDARLRQLLPPLLAGLLFFAMALRGVAHKSGTYDEYVHVTAGYSYWTLGDYRLNSENGNWSQRWVALPLLGGREGFPSLDQPAWRASNMWDLSDQFFFGSGRDADRALFRARTMVAIVGALLVVLVFFWSRSLFGDAGAWVSAAVAAFSPTLLAHGALATSDVIGAAFFAAATWSIWRVLHRATASSILASTLATAGLFLTKLSAPLIIPIALGMVAARVVTAEPARRARQVARCGGLALLHAAVVVALIWASFGFRYGAFAVRSTPQDTFIDPWSELLTEPTLPNRMAAWGREHHVLPEAYLYGLTEVTAYAKDRSSFLNGEVTQGGSHWFFPYAALVKTTIPELVLLLLVPVMLIRRRRDGVLYDAIPLLLLIGVYGISAVAGSLDIGFRHLLPIVPALAVLAGAAALPVSKAVGGDRSRRTLVLASFVILLVVGHVAESIRIAPNYLAYFNELIGGPKQAYKHLVDSSLDWGQDLPALKDWLDNEGAQKPGHPAVYLSYFGTAFPSRYGIDAVALPGMRDRWTPHEPEPLTAGIYCISATMLQGVYLMPQGPWAKYETDYRSMLDNLRLYDSTGVNAATRAALVHQTGEAFWPRMFYAFEQYRFDRLITHLRTREPDAQIGYSILVYRVSDDELKRALYGVVE